MVVNVKPEQLSEAIRGQLEEYSADVTKAINQNLKEVADKTADALKKGGSYKERTGKYTPDWSVSARKVSSVAQSESYSVHNRKHYQLTHLLEKDTSHGTAAGRGRLSIFYPLNRRRRNWQSKRSKKPSGARMGVSNGR